MSNVFTYFMPVPGLYDINSQYKLIDVWRRSWKKAGWNPIVLDESTTRRHPRYEFFKSRYWALPTEYGHDYCGACFFRWLAVAVAGGGMLADYDVINYGFEPRKPGDKMRLYCEPLPRPVFMGAVLGTAQQFETMAQIFADWGPDEFDWNKNAKPAPMMHCDDLSMLIRMFISGTYPKPEWFVRDTGCGLFSHPTSGRPDWPSEAWRTTKLVHYGYRMKAAGFWPKHKHIEKLRPF